MPKDEPQHLKQGKVTTNLLDSMKIPYEVLSSEMNSKDSERILKKMLNYSLSHKTPCALLIKKATFKNYKPKLEKGLEAEALSIFNKDTSFL